MSICSIVRLTLSISLIISAICYNRYTPWSPHGGGNIIFLDRHPVYCENGEALYGFKLMRIEDSDKIYYRYGCKATESVSTEGEYTEYTRWVPASDWAIEQSYTAHKLEGLNVKCRNDFGLKGFKLESQCGKTICDIRYKYTCVPLKPIDCSSGETPQTDNQDGQNFTLEKQIILLNDYEVLTGFKLKVFFYYRYLTRDGRAFSYAYDFCTLRNAENEKQQYSNNKSRPTNP